MYIQHTIQWIQSMVIALNLCPFAKYEMDKNSVRIEVSPATLFEDGVLDLMKEIEYLNQNPNIATSLLLFPHGFNDFLEYLDFVDLANHSMEQTGYEGIYQLATFHPEYQFHGTRVNDVTNYTNRSPYPMLHLLREEMLDRAIAFYGPTETIPENNMKSLQELGLAEVRKRLKKCYDAPFCDKA